MCDKVPTKYWGTSDTMAPFQGVWRNYFTWQMNYTCSNDVRRNKVTFFTLFHLGCIEGKISLGLWKIQVRGQIISPGVVLRHDWLFAFFVRQCCHLQADLHINPLHHRKRGVSSLLLGPTIIWLLIIDWLNYSGSKTTVKPLDYGCLQQFNSVPYFAVYSQF